MTASRIRPELQAPAKKVPQVKYNRFSVWLINLIMPLIPAPKAPQDVTIKNIHFSNEKNGNKIRLRVYQAVNASTPSPALIWFHGGGHLIGTPELDEAECIEYAREAGVVVFSVDYRLSPKHPFPAELEDAHAALNWVATHSNELGVDPNRIAVGGSSAGAGLAASLSQFARDQKSIKPVFQLLVYPMLDDRTVLRNDIDDSENISWSQKSNRFGWESLLGVECGSEHVPAYAVPARLADLSHLPPAWIGVGSLDIFHDEDIAYGKRLKESGVECETVIVDGAFHAFDRFGTDLQFVREFRKSQINALKKHLSK